MVDRLLTINIRKYLVGQPRSKRANKAVKYIRERVAHYTKIKEENVRLGQELNSLIFKYYSKRMVPVKLKVKIGTDTADVLPFKEGVPEKPVSPEAAKKAEKEAKEKKPLISKVEEKKQPPSQPATSAAPQKKEEKKQAQKPEQKPSK